MAFIRQILPYLRGAGGCLCFSICARLSKEVSRNDLRWDSVNRPDLGDDAFSPFANAERLHELEGLIGQEYDSQPTRHGLFTNNTQGFQYGAYSSQEGRFGNTARSKNRPRRCTYAFESALTSHCVSSILILV